MPTAIKGNIYFGLLVFWIALSAFQYGYHISALNASQSVISCSETGDGRQEDGVFGLPSCISMTETQFGLLTSIYTVGGLLGSLFAGRLADVYGRRSAVIYAAASIGVGGALMALAGAYWIIVLGRFVVGIGCGLSTVLVPMYLSEVSPAKIRGSIGVLNQLSIVTGILAAQALSLPLARPSIWRFIPLISVAISLGQILLSPGMIESPKWAGMKRGVGVGGERGELDAEDGVEDEGIEVEDEDRDALLGGNSEDREPPSTTGTEPSRGRDQQRQLSIPELIKSRDPAVKKGTRTVLIAMIAQQASGINAVLYYSTSIMSAVFPANAKMIALIITIVNFFVTFPPIYLIEKLGRKRLLLLSTISMSLSSLLLAFSINASAAVVSCIAVFGFVASFGIGLGPIPFVIINEVVPGHATSAVGSLGLALNWSTNFLVGILFLPLRDLLSGGTGKDTDGRGKVGGAGEGNIFFLFALLSALATVLIARSPFGVTR